MFFYEDAYKTKFIGLPLLRLKVLRHHLWVSPITLPNERRKHSLPECLTNGDTARSVLAERARVSDEGDPKGNGGGVGAVHRRAVAHQMLHHSVFGHVLHEVRLLEKNKHKDMNCCRHS